MSLTIRTTGVDDYIDGSANVQMLMIGGPGSGKTRTSSFWPKPLYADCENGRGSIADRKVPYAEIKSSQDMLDLLAFAKSKERIPKQDRPFQTIVIDTIDAFSRLCKDEWIQQTRSQSFKGYDAWGYLETKMTMLMTRLLNLDYNVIVLAHFKSKSVKDGDNETIQLGLQLQGDIATTLFNDFDLVGWLGTYWGVEDGERVEKRGLTFKRTPDKPFLKDRYGVMPVWMPVNFDDEDYGQIFGAFLSRVDDLPESEVVGEIPSSAPEGTVPSAGVVGPSSGGPLPEVKPVDVPLKQFDRVTLAKMARDEGVTHTTDGVAIKGNTGKGELIDAIEKKRSGGSETHAASASQPAPAEPAPTPAPAASAEPTPEPRKAEQWSDNPTFSEQFPARPGALPTPETVETEAGTVDTATGEVTDSQALATVTEALGATVVSQTIPDDTKPASPSKPAAAAPLTTPELTATHCEEEGCHKRLDVENQDYVKLSFIKFTKRLCNEHYLAAKKKRP